MMKSIIVLLGHWIKGRGKPSEDLFIRVVAFRSVALCEHLLRDSAKRWRWRYYMSIADQRFSLEADFRHSRRSNNL